MLIFNNLLLQINFQFFNLLFLQRLQVIQNAAARLVTGVRRSEHMTPILRYLHWLPVRRRITFKTAGLARHGSTVPSDILWADVNSCHPGTSIRSLRPTEPEQITATAVSPSKDLVYGTVFLPHYEHQTLHWQRSGTNWRHFCSTCNCSYSAFAAF